MAYLMYLMILTLSAVVLLHSTAAQFSIREKLFSNTSCDLNSVQIDCGSSNVIALQQVQYGYNPQCNTTCCQFNASDCLVTVQDSSSIKRECSGRSSCNVTLVNSTQVFCTYGAQEASYIYMEYVCIQKSRIVSVCSNNTINSTELPLYLTNEGYPGDTVGNNSCSCSFEAKSCSSGVTSYIMDADMYDDPTNCLQSLLITDAGGELQESVNCKNYNYSMFVTQKNLSSNYYHMYFDNNSTHNSTGHFFIGFQATDHGVPFSLSCPNNSASWCIDCGIPKNITDGMIMLGNQSVYNSTASVTCSPGFHAVNETIVCQEQGIWSSSACIIKDCGQPPKISMGSVTLLDPNNTTFGARATVTCVDGYKSDVSSIACLANGSWESVNCTIVDCRQPPTISMGRLTLLDPNSTTFGAKATLTCDNGYASEVFSTSCLATGSWKDVTCTIIDCGPLPAISGGDLTLLDPTSTTFDSRASVTCYTGFQSEITTISCLDTASWERASCTAIECGAVADISFGVIRPADSANLSYGAEAVVECDEEYTASKSLIHCLASGMWENTSCIVIVSASTVDHTAIIIFLVLFVGVPCLIQLSVASFLHITIYTHNPSSAEKAVGYILLSAIPYIGVVFIMRFYKWKGYHGYLVDNQRKKPLHPEYETIHRNTLDDHEGNGQTSAKNRFSNPGYEILYNPARSTVTITANSDRYSKKEDEARMNRLTQDDAATATHYDNITKEQKADNPDYENGNLDDIAKVSTAIITVTQT